MKTLALGVLIVLGLQFAPSLLSGITTEQVLLFLAVVIAGNVIHIARRAGDANKRDE